MSIALKNIQKNLHHDLGFDVSERLLLDILDQPIMFNRVYVRVTRNALAALMLSYAVHARNQLEFDIREREVAQRGHAVVLDEEKAGWVAIADGEFAEHTGMTISEIRRVKKYLADQDLMHSRKMNGFTWYQINHESIASKIAALY